jgi:predicted RNA-binding protein with PUA-like domain
LEDHELRFWLIKSEPSVFSIDDLAASKNKTTCWDGVRNYQARNFMRDDMRKGDLAFYYHSSCEPAGIVGIVEVVKTAYADHTAFDSQHEHFDPKSKVHEPTWYMVDFKLKRKLKRMITLHSIKQHLQALPNLLLLRKGNRLSVMPIEKQEWDFILSLE